MEVKRVQQDFGAKVRLLQVMLTVAEVKRMLNLVLDMQQLDIDKKLIEKLERAEKRAYDRMAEE